MDIVVRVCGGERLSLEGMDADLAAVIAQCWDQSPAKRPTMLELYKQLSALYDVVAASPDPTVQARWHRAGACVCVLPPGHVAAGAGGDDSAVVCHGDGSGGGLPVKYSVFGTVSSSGRGGESFGELPM